MLQAIQDFRMKAKDAGNLETDEHMQVAAGGRGRSTSSRRSPRWSTCRPTTPSPSRSRATRGPAGASDSPWAPSAPGRSTRRLGRPRLRWRLDQRHTTTANFNFNNNGNINTGNVGSGNRWNASNKPSQRPNRPGSTTPETGRTAAAGARPGKGGVKPGKGGGGARPGQRRAGGSAGRATDRAASGVRAQGPEAVGGAGKPGGAGPRGASKPGGAAVPASRRARRPAAVRAVPVAREAADGRRRPSAPARARAARAR